jgi:cytochrome c biogenesis protein CcmG/thiol:disulfide interchange protein DsbE
MIIFLVSPSIYAQISPGKTKVSIATIGQRSPEIIFNDINNNIVTLSEKRGKPIFINFWASWCTPCQDEAQMINKIFEEYKDKITFIGINLTKKDSISEAQKMIEKFHLKYNIFFDFDGNIANNYRIQTIPSSFLIDKNGIIKEKIIGVVFEVELKKKLDLLLEKPFQKT